MAKAKLPKKPTSKAPKAMSSTTRRPKKPPRDTSLDAAVLAAAPEIFQLSRRATGVAAIFFGYIKGPGLFKTAGYDTMEAYAKAKLDVHSVSAYKKIRSAAAVIWAEYESLCHDIIRRLTTADTSVILDLPEVPNQSDLAALNRAVKRVTSEEKDGLVKSVFSGTCVGDDLEKVGRLPPAKGNNAAAGDVLPPEIAHAIEYLSKARTLLDAYQSETLDPAALAVVRTEVRNVDESFRKLEEDFGPGLVEEKGATSPSSPTLMPPATNPGLLPRAEFLGAQLMPYGHFAPLGTVPVGPTHGAVNPPKSADTQVDVTGDADADAFMDVLRTLLADNRVYLVAMHLNLPPHKRGDAAEAIGWCDDQYAFVLPEAGQRVVDMHLRSNNRRLQRTGEALFAALVKRKYVLPAADGTIHVIQTAGGMPRGVFRIPIELLARPPVPSPVHGAPAVRDQGMGAPAVERSHS